MVYGVLEHKYFMRNSEKDFVATLFNCEVSIKIASEILEINIDSVNCDETIEEDLFFDLLHLFFLCLGAFPKINELTIGRDSVDLERLQVRFFSDEAYIKEFYVFTEIKREIVTENYVNNIRKIMKSNNYLSSLEYLVSDTYKSVINDHKITLLSHVLEGVCPKMPKYEKERLLAIIPVDNDKIVYTHMVYHVLERYLFEVGSVGSELLEAMGADRVKFAKTVSDTRNSNSHSLDKSYKPLKLKKGNDMVIYFVVIYIALRCAIMEKVEIEYDKLRVIECYNTIYDWMQYNSEEDLKLKSKAYLSYKALEEMKQILENEV